MGEGEKSVCLGGGAWGCASLSNTRTLTHSHTHTLTHSHTHSLTLCLTRCSPVFHALSVLKVYGVILGKRRYGKQHVLALSDVSVRDLDDGEGELDYGIEVMHKRKSFHVS